MDKISNYVILKKFKNKYISVIRISQYKIRLYLQILQSF